MISDSLFNPLLLGRKGGIQFRASLSRTVSATRSSTRQRPSPKIALVFVLLDSTRLSRLI